MSLTLFQLHFLACSGSEPCSSASSNSSVAQRAFFFFPARKKARKHTHVAHPRPQTTNLTDSWWPALVGKPPWLLCDPQSLACCHVVEMKSTPANIWRLKGRNSMKIARCGLKSTVTRPERFPDIDFQAILVTPRLNIFLFVYYLTLFARDAGAFAIRISIFAIEFIVVDILHPLIFPAYSRICVAGVRGATRRALMSRSFINFKDGKKKRRGAVHVP